MLRRTQALSLLIFALLLASCAPKGQGTGNLVTGTAPPTTLPTRAASSPPAGIPDFSHIFVIVMENQEYGTIIGNSAAPYINSLAAQYGLAASYYAITHPSLPNYLELLGGSTFGITSDCETCFVNAPNLVDQLEASHKTWKAYMEDMPSPCFIGDSGQYAMRHNPFIYFDDIRTNPARCSNVVPLTALTQDLATNHLPDFAWITPNVCHDMHDCSVSTGDSWLQGFLPQILHAATRQPQIAVFLVWDEGSTNASCCTIASGGHVPMLLISPLDKHSFASSVNYDHASLLLTIEDAWHLGTMNDTACACTAPMNDFYAP